MRYRLLGPFEVQIGDRSLAVSGGKQRAILALLLINANRVVSAERLIDELWGENPPATASKSIQVHVSQLRKVLREGGNGMGQAVVTQGGGYMLRVAPGDVDLQLFEQALDEAQGRLAGGDARGADARLRDALALWRGPPLADFTYEPFAQREIARLEELRLTAIETRIDAGLALGEHDRLIADLEGLARDHPLRERFCAQLMLALYRCGRQAEALAAYRRTAGIFREELGIEPTPMLRELERQILSQHPDVGPPSAPRTGHAEAPGAVASRAPAGLRLRWPAVVTAAALVLGGAAAVAALEEGGSRRSEPLPLDVARNSIVAVDLAEREPEFAVPLPGRPTGVVATPRELWIASVDSAALTGIDTSRRSITRTAPLRGEPDAVAVGGGSVWVADGSRGVLARFRPNYSVPAATVRFPRAPPGPAPPGRRRVARSSLAAGAGALWLTNGSRDLVRVDPQSNATESIRVGGRLIDVAVGAGAVWAVSATDAAVYRIDPRRKEVTDRVPIAGRTGGDAPSPIGVAAAQRWVWVLNGNTATVTTIDASTRGVLATVLIGADRVPTDIAAARGRAWIANGDGTLSHIDGGSSTAKSIWIGESLEEVATDGSRVWASTTALDQRLPGGSQ